MLSFPPIPGSTPQSRMSTPSMERQAHPPQSGKFFSPTNFQHHPLFITTNTQAYRAAPPEFQLTASQRHTPSATFTKSFVGNWQDTGLGSIKRKSELIQKSKTRKQKSLVERAKMKQELISIEEKTRIRRFKARENRKAFASKQYECAILLQRVFRGYSIRHYLIIQKFLKQLNAVHKIIKCYRVYCLVRIAKSDRGIMAKIKAEDHAARILQKRIEMWHLKRTAKARILLLRDNRESERVEFLRLLREKAAMYLQRTFRGMLDRNMVIKMAVEKQVLQAQERLSLMDGGETKEMGIISLRNEKYKKKGQRSEE